MTTTIRLIGATCMALCLALALPNEDLFAKKGDKGKGGGGGNKEQTVVVAQLTLRDDPGNRVLSDGKVRLDPAVTDTDGDGFGELIEPNNPPLLDVTYQDHRISFEQSGFYPDPCSGFPIVTGGPNTGRVFADLDRGAGDASTDCTIFEDSDVDPSQKFLNDARTITLVFDNTDPCACDEFSFLNEPVLGGVAAKTTFVHNGDSCSLTLANGPIATDSDSPRTSNPRIIAFPFAEVKGKKGAPPTPAMSTSVHINFVVDRAVAGEANQWGVWSHEEDIDVTLAGSDTRDVMSTSQSFDLIHFGVDSPEAPTCSGFTLPFQMTFTRFEVLAQ